MMSFSAPFARLKSLPLSFLCYGVSILVGDLVLRSAPTVMRFMEEESNCRARLANILMESFEEYTVRQDTQDVWE